MRAQRAIWIAGGVLVLAVVLVVLRSPPRAVRASIIAVTNDGAPYYLIQVTNCTRRPYDVGAWSESTLNGVVWKRRSTIRPLKLPPSQAHHILLMRPDEGKRRVTVACYPIATRNWERWRDRIKALCGIKPSQAHQVHLDVE